MTQQYSIGKMDIFEKMKIFDRVTEPKILSVDELIDNHISSGCQHLNIKNTGQIDYVCQDCGMCVQNMQSDYLSPPVTGQRPFYVAYQSKEIRDFMKLSTFEEICKSRIEQVKQNKKKLNIVDDSDIQIPDDIITQAITESNTICSELKMKGNNPFKVYVYRVRLLCRQRCIFIKDKQLVNILGVNPANVKKWSFIGQKICQDYKLSINYNDSLQNIDINHIQIEDEQQVIVEDLCDISNALSSTGVTPTKQEIDLYTTLMDVIETTHICFSSTTQIKTRNIATLLMFLRLYKFTNPNRSIFGSKNPDWKEFLTYLKTNKLVSTPFKKFVHDLKEQKTVIQQQIIDDEIKAKIVDLFELMN